MSYAIIRNEKYKRENLKGIYRHIERRNKNYSNKNIDKEKSNSNYSFVSKMLKRSKGLFLYFFSILFLLNFNFL